MRDHYLTVGKSEIRKSSLAKVLGTAQYVADIHCPDACCAMLLRSTHHHARLLEIDTASASTMAGVFAVLTARDIPGSKVLGLRVKDRPVLAIDVVRHVGEPIALVVAENSTAAQRAIDAISVLYEPLPAVFDPVSALEPNATLVHSHSNLLAHYDLQDGNIAAGFAEADVVLAETFSVPRVSPAYIETEGVIAQWNDDASLIVWTNSQSPFDDQRQIAEVLNLPDSQVCVKCDLIGGGFGGKDDSALQILAALGAWATKRTVRLVNTVQDSFLGHPKRHPAQIHCRIGAKSDGTLVALHSTAYLDTGAYASYGPAVGAHLTEVIQGPYRIPNVRAETFVVYTNSPLSGAMRGFGSPQANFAIESMMDMLAAALGMDPIDLRRRNILQPGDRLFTGVVLDESARSLSQCLQLMEAERQHLIQIPPARGKISGVGLAMCIHGMGFGAQIPDDSTHRLECLPDGTVRVHVGAPDLGQGLATAAEQITAEALGIPYVSVEAIGLDTSTTPNGGGTFGSRTTYLMGNALLRAVEKLKALLLSEVAMMVGVHEELLTYDRGKVLMSGGRSLSIKDIVRGAASHGARIEAEATFSFPYPEHRTPQGLPLGIPHVLFCLGAHLVRIEVDPSIGTIEVEDYLTVHDVGTAINRAAVEGQIEGGVVTGLGYALYENMCLKHDGRWVDSFSEYLLPTARDVPGTIKHLILEIPEVSGPYGAKGVGEIGLVPVAAAIANAVYSAIGKRVTALPISPDNLIDTSDRAQSRYT